MNAPFNAPDRTRLAIARAYKKGVPVKVILHKFGVHSRVLYSVIEEFGLKNRGWGTTTKAQRKQIAEAYADGVGLKAIVAEFRIHKRIIYQAIAEYGVPVRREKIIDPNIIGAHEVDPLRCPHCAGVLPWALVKGWR